MLSHRIAPRDAARTACGRRPQPRGVAAASRGRPCLRASGRSAHARRMLACREAQPFSKHGQLLARAARRGTHGLRPEAAATWRGCRVSWQGVPACLRPQRPCEANTSVPRGSAILQAWSATGSRRETRHARPAAGGAQPRGVAAASRGRPCIWPQCPCEANTSVPPGSAILKAWSATGSRRETPHARPAAGGRSHVAWLPRLVAGRACVPLAAVPMRGKC